MDRWIFMSDVCKHCTNAGCLDACPTGALIRTEHQTVVAAGRRVQRMRVLHPGMPVRGRGSRPHRRPGRQVHALLRPAAGRARARVREGMPDRLDPVRPLRRTRRGRRAAGRRRCTSAASRARTSTAPGTSRATTSPAGSGAFFLLTEPPERFGLPANAESPVQENVVPATVAALGAGLLAAAGAVAAFASARRRA